MPDVLSQAQIDELLKGFSSGEVDVEEKSQEVRSDNVKAYDFRSPKKFGREQMKLLDSIFEHFSRQMSSYFSGMLRLISKISIVQIEEQRYYEYNNALPDYAIIGLIDLNPAVEQLPETTIMMQVSMPVALTLIDRLLGSSIGPGNIDSEKEFTEIELALIENLLNSTLRFMKEAWGQYIEIDPMLSSLETNSRLLQNIAPDETVVIVALDVEIRDIQGRITICIPAINLEELFGKFNTKFSKTKRFDIAREEERRNDIMREIKESRLGVKALLSTDEFSFLEILSLQVDDVLPLSKKVTETLDVHIEGNLWFQGHMGTVNKKKAIRIAGDPQQESTQ